MHEIFDFVTGLDKTVTIKLSEHSEHEFQHGDSFIYNITSVVFEPYDTNLDSSVVNYDERMRVSIRVQDTNLHVNYSNTKFVLLSSFEYDASKLASISDDRMEHINNDKVSLVLADSSVTFTNIRFEDKFYNMSHDGVVFIQATHIESDMITLK